jgi:hypothetical protein
MDFYGSAARWTTPSRSFPPIFSQMKCIYCHKGTIIIKPT